MWKLILIDLVKMMIPFLWKIQVFLILEVDRWGEKATLGSK